MRYTIPLLLLFIYSSVVFSTPSMDEKIGQLLIFGFHGSDAQPNASIIKMIQRYHLGGVILFNRDYLHDKNIFARNIQNKQQVKQLISDLQKASKIPLFVTIDQEGGTAERLLPEHGFKHTYSAKKLGQLNDPTITKKNATTLASELKSVGFNVNFFPVVDLELNTSSIIISQRERSFSADPKRVIAQSQIFIDTFHKNNLLCSLKHFPGHGSAAGDSHEGFVDISATWSPIELAPYKQLTCDFVMVAHMFNKQLDPNYPASLSKSTIQNLLRNQLKFNGLVITDDLGMGAISKHYTLQETIKLALQAGNDLLIFGNGKTNDDLLLPYKVFTTIKTLLAKGEITPARINQSYEHIMAVKHRYFSKDAIHG